MFCKNCGKEVENDTKFCPSCGTVLNLEEKKQEVPVRDDEIVLTLKPRFISISALLMIIPPTFFFSIWCGVFLGGISQIFFAQHGGVNIWPFLIFAILPLLIIPPASYFMALGKNRNTIYKFYRTKVEYHEGFLGKDTKTLSYNRVLETELRRGVIQQQFGVGSVFLSTGGAAISGAGGNGVSIADIPNPEENYKLIKDLIDKCPKSRN